MHFYTCQFLSPNFWLVIDAFVGQVFVVEVVLYFSHICGYVG